MGKIRDNVYELPRGRYSKVAVDMKEGAWERQDCEAGKAGWRLLGIALLAKLRRKWGARRILAGEACGQIQVLEGSPPRPMDDGP